MNDINFLVRVQCLTYNHALYIVDAMNGFTMQETTFPYLCVIVDDASTDGEPEVIRQYLHDNFDLDDALITQQDETENFVRVFSRHKNNMNCYFLIVFLKYNHHSIEKPKGSYYKDWVQGIKYIAICEGDDYWIDPLKLTKQVSYLENHPNCGLATGFSKYLIQERQILVKKKGKVNSDFRSILLNGGTGCATCTILYRIECINGYSELVKGQKWLMGDFPLLLYISLHYDIYCFDDFFSTYRILQESASHSKSYEKTKKFIKSVFDIQLFFANLYEPDMIATIEQNNKRKLLENAIDYSQSGDVKKYFTDIKKHTCSDYILICKYFVKRLLKNA